jgi:hydroxymethylpyrimidine pyrophosphatase-like HAD family hydrolase
MRYLALATDYDGTLAHQGRVNEPTLAALKRLQASGRRLILVTGRELPELLEVFPKVGIFDLVVAENGALLYQPKTQRETLLGQGPPDAFVQELRRRGVDRLSVGKVVVATWLPHDGTALAVIQEQGLDLQVVLNKQAVMILPNGLNKASGLKLALQNLGISPGHVVAIGDAENDRPLLESCGVGVAVSNAVPSLKADAHLVTQADHGAGVAELIDRMLENDLRDLALARESR